MIGKKLTKLSGFFLTSLYLGLLIAYATIMALCVDAVVFDLGRVLINYDWSGPVRQLSSLTGFCEEDVKSRVFNRDIFQQFERGQIEPASFYRRVCDSVGLTMSFEEFCGLWNSIFTEGEVEPIVKVAKRLLSCSNIKVAALSNTNFIHVQYLKKIWPLLNQLPYQFLSCEMGSRKPEEAIFTATIKTLRVEPEKILFVDDLKDNIIAARKFGLITVHVQDPFASAEEIESVIFNTTELDPELLCF
ncbi:MAG: hypothetical protein A3K03_12700 [Bdellovibrionales bacterium RIFOXYD1_FULL_44_7]|nr:MAG: hypothetical protein A3K03_12700 [Bdellovibrionales bacterium RIFOXYD1_FULL_44_7]